MGGIKDEIAEKERLIKAWTADVDLPRIGPLVLDYVNLRFAPDSILEQIAEKILKEAEEAKHGIVGVWIRKDRRLALLGKKVLLVLGSTEDLYRNDGSPALVNLVDSWFPDMTADVYVTTLHELKQRLLAGWTPHHGFEEFSGNFADQFWAGLDPREVTKSA